MVFEEPRKSRLGTGVHRLFLSKSVAQHHGKASILYDSEKKVRGEQALWHLPESLTLQMQQKKHGNGICVTLIDDHLINS